MEYTHIFLPCGVLLFFAIGILYSCMKNEIHNTDKDDDEEIDQ